MKKMRRPVTGRIQDENILIDFSDFRNLSEIQSPDGIMV